MLNYTKARTRQTKLNIFNGNINACVSASNSTLLNLKSQLTTLQSSLTLAKDSLGKMLGVFNPDQFCGLGSSVTKWLDKYSYLKQFNLKYLQTSYCEKNFILATIELLKLKVSEIEQSIKNINTAITTEEANYQKAVSDYNNCMYLETQLTQAQTTQTKALTEQTQAEMIAEEKSTFAKVLPFIAGAVIVGGGVYFITKKKKRR